MNCDFIQNAITLGYQSHNNHDNFRKRSLLLSTPNQQNLNVDDQTVSCLLMLFSLKLQLNVQIAWHCGICMYEIAILQHFTVFGSWKCCQVVLVINIFFWKYSSDPFFMRSQCTERIGFGIRGGGPAVPVREKWGKNVDKNSIFFMNSDVQLVLGQNVFGA